MRLTLNISPCPNDTFMFDALLHGRIDTEGLSFELRMLDIEALNAAALRAEADITKISYAVLPQITANYCALNSGSALGRRNGPLLVAREPVGMLPLNDLRVAIPGVHTTANLLLDRLFPEITDKRPRLFSQIAPAVQMGEFDAGVLIHEGRFTYANLGLHLVADLGAVWESRTGLPLPLGAIAVSKRQDGVIHEKIDRVLHRSIEYAFAHPLESADFVRTNARELSETVIRSHIELFVNDYSLNLGEEGRRAVQTLLNLNPEEIFA